MGWPGHGVFPAWTAEQTSPSRSKPMRQQYLEILGGHLGRNDKVQQPSWRGLQDRTFWHYSELICTFSPGRLGDILFKHCSWIKTNVTPQLCWHPDFRFLGEINFCCLKKKKKKKIRDFPGGPVTKTLSSQCRRPEFNPWSGTRSHLQQLRPDTAK